MPNPYAQITGLQKASSIGAGSEDINKPQNWQRGEMPLAPGVFNPWKAAFGESESVLDGLRRLLGAGGGGKVAQAATAVPKTSQALSGLASAIPGEADMAAQSVRDFTNPGSQRAMNQMYQEANPVFKGLEDAGTFAGPRNVGAMPQAAPGGLDAMERIKLGMPPETPLPTDIVRRATSAGGRYGPGNTPITLPGLLGQMTPKLLR
jgi:hypothetical protein